MRILLRCIRSRNYFLDHDQWTAERGLARDFGTSGRAILFALENQLSGLEVVLAFDNPQYDLSIPLQNGLSHSPGKQPKRP